MQVEDPHEAGENCENYCTINTRMEAYKQNSTTWKPWTDETCAKESATRSIVLVETTSNWVKCRRLLKGHTLSFQHQGDCQVHETPWRTTRCRNKICHEIVFREHPTLQSHNWSVCDASAMLECPHLDFVFDMLKWISIVENNYTMPDNKYSRSQWKCLRCNYTWGMQECPNLDSVLECWSRYQHDARQLKSRGHRWRGCVFFNMLQKHLNVTQCTTRHNELSEVPAQATKWQQDVLCNNIESNAS